MATSSRTELERIMESSARHGDDWPAEMIDAILHWHDAETQKQILAANRELLAILEQILEDGDYDDAGDFFLLHREGEKPEDDYIDHEAIEKAREIITRLRTS